MARPFTIALANSGRKWIGEVAHVAMLYEQLEALGHRPWIVCRRGYALEARARERGWRHLSLAFDSRFHPLHDLADIRSWVAWGRREHVDLLHCHRGKDHLLGVAVARRLRRPLVRTRHVVTPVHLHPFNRWLYLRATDAILCVSRAARASFGAWADDLPRGRVLLSAVDSVRFHPDRRDPAWRREMDPHPGQGSETEPTVWFGLVGRLQNIKGHRYYLQAAARVAAELPEARFLLAGEGSDAWRGRLIDQIRELGISDRVRLAGRLDDLPRALASLDVGVIASIGSEGSSRIALEMMASGLPLAATHVGGIPDLLEPAGGGRLVPPRDADALAGAMLHWARDAEARRTAGTANRRHIEAHHQPRDWAAAIAGIYTDLICLNQRQSCS